MSHSQRRHEQGSALMMAVLLLLLMGLIGFAALDTVTRDLQVTGAQYRKQVSFYAAEAAVSEALQTLLNTGSATVTPTQLGDTGSYPHGRPAYRLDTTAADPVESLGVTGFPGMNLQLGQNGAPQFQLEMHRIRVQGTAPGGSVSRVEFATGTLVAN